MPLSILLGQARVIATFRSPDGESWGRIIGLVIEDLSGRRTVDLHQAIDLAAQGRLFVTDPWGNHAVKVYPVDENGDQYFDYVTTSADGRLPNNLLSLPIQTGWLGSLAAALNY